MRDISQKGYTTEEIWSVLRGEQGFRTVKFRYLLLDENENLKDELFEVESASVEMAAFSDIKRTAKFSLREEETTSSVRTEKKLIDFQNTRLSEV